MRIDKADFRGDKKYTYYNFFMVGNAASKYKLQVGGYSGTAGDSLDLHGHSPCMTETTTCMTSTGNCALVTKLKEDGGIGPARTHNSMVSIVMTQHQYPIWQFSGNHSLGHLAGLLK